MPKLTHVIVFMLMMLLGGSYVTTFANLPLPMAWMNELIALAPIQIVVLAYFVYRSHSKTINQNSPD